MIPFVWLSLGFHHRQIVICGQQFKLDGSTIVWVKTYKNNWNEWIGITLCVTAQNCTNRSVKKLFSLYRSDLRFELNASQMDLWVRFRLQPKPMNPTTGCDVSSNSGGKAFASNTVIACIFLSLFFFCFEWKHPYKHPNVASTIESSLHFQWRNKKKKD